MQIVLDTVCVKSLLRPPKGRKTSGANPRFKTKLDQYMNDDFQIALDPLKGVVAEWGKTGNLELIEQLVIHWESLNGIVIVAPRRSLSPITKRLKDLGFSDPGDSLMARIAADTEDNIVVSNDSDFWDPRDKQSVGDNTTVVATLLLTTFGIHVWSLFQLIVRLKAA